MRDRPYLDEHSDLVSAGLLAEDVVFAATTLKKKAPLSETEERALTSARTLLTFIAAPQVRHGGHVGISNLSGSTGALEALRVVESYTPRANVAKFLETLVGVIDRALEGQDVSAEAGSLQTMQRLFAALGDVALARANSLAGASEDRLLWRSATTTSISS